MKAPVAAAAGAVALAVYEFVAVLTHDVPTVTHIVESGPEWVEVSVVGGLMAWLAWHFGWFRHDSS